MAPMTVRDQPGQPPGLRARGARFWQGTLTAFTLEAGEAELLAETCRALDLLDDLRAVIERDGLTITTAADQPRMHPAVAELRSTRLLVGRLLAQLKLPDTDGEAMIDSPLSARGRAAAHSRWGGNVGKEARRDGA
jgi:Phage terminase, small subunit